MLNQYLQNKHLILASGSPRRQQFLTDLGLAYEIRLKPTEETYPENLSGSAITDHLALLKAAPFRDELQENDILITADTIVWLNNRALGKPENRDDAIRILQTLSGKMHEVITSVALTSVSKQQVIHEITRVFFKKLSHEEIVYYLDNYQPYDKAGSYGIQEWIGYIGIEKIEGSFYNVMGFPTRKFYETLLNFI